MLLWEETMHSTLYSIVEKVASETADGYPNISNANVSVFRRNIVHSMKNYAQEFPLFFYFTLHGTRKLRNSSTSLDFALRILSRIEMEENWASHILQEYTSHTFRFS
ncbi:hypothetical protein TNCV_3407551 [Trichonephila clavipes]|uniref:Uncharacterized protein n=1 Tax=Trichonephila clavipes TaxID=2585209 RepID=A0A8X6RET0_TRICX|nr:hypothetical protein TNCV_3407551 [Trichonephila clavipes]